jgi:hypothetical protein
VSEALNFNEELLNLYKREPFTPFTIVLASGDRHEVTEPLRMAMNDNTVALVPPRSTVIFFRKNQIAGVEVHEPAA